MKKVIGFLRDAIRLVGLLTTLAIAIQVLLAVLIQ